MATHMIGRAIRNWFTRHRNPLNLALHAAGIPACFTVAPLLLIFQQWWWALGMFVGGYVLQFLGHAIEGNNSGEAMLLRRILGRGRRDDDNNTPKEPADES